MSEMTKSLRGSNVIAFLYCRDVPSTHLVFVFGRIVAQIRLLAFVYKIEWCDRARALVIYSNSCFSVVVAVSCLGNALGIKVCFSCCLSSCCLLAARLLVVV